MPKSSNRKWFAWISPEGKVFPCAYGEHYDLISQLFKVEKDLEHEKFYNDEDALTNIELLYRTDDYAINLGWVKVMAIWKDGPSEMIGMVVTNNNMWNSTKESALWEFAESISEDAKALSHEYKKAALDMAEYL